MANAVIFDLDGVITDTAIYHFHAWKRIADEYGVDFDEAANEHLKGVDRLNSLRWILARGNVYLNDADFLAAAERKNEHYLSLIADMQPQDIFPGVAELIQQLKACGFAIGLASVSKNAGFVLQRLQITELFDYAADAAKIAEPKPHPEIFLTVAAALGVQPADSVGVEDAVAGISAIKAAGMPAIGVGSAEVLTDADKIVARTGDITLADIRALLTA